MIMHTLKVALLLSISIFPLFSSAESFDLSQYKGKVVYLDFWVSWCGPCQLSFPWMEQISHSYKKDGLEVLAVNLDTQRAAAERFLKRQLPSFTVAFDPTGFSAEKWGVVGMPQSFLIDRKGEVIRSFKGFRPQEKEEIESAIREALFHETHS